MKLKVPLYVFGLAVIGSCTGQIVNDYVPADWVFVQENRREIRSVEPYAHGRLIYFDDDRNMYVPKENTSLINATPGDTLCEIVEQARGWNDVLVQKMGINENAHGKTRIRTKLVKQQ
jgi:hypothetical protein